MTHHPGKVVMQGMSRDLLLDLDREEAKTMPNAGKWVALPKLTRNQMTYEIDMGSLMLASSVGEADMDASITALLEDIGRICRGDWTWSMGDRTVYSEVWFSQAVSKKVSPEEDRLVTMPSDLRKILYINFASKDDAMLSRMTVLDLRSLQNDHGRGPATQA